MPNETDFIPSRGEWKRDLAPGQISSGPMRLLNGDGDIFSKKGRSTRVTLNARNIRISPDGHAFLVDVHYAVFERHPDNTYLTWDGTARCDIPLDARSGSSYAADVTAYDRTWDVMGKEHRVLPVPLDGSSCISEGFYRIDGLGDDLTNARIELKLSIPFRYYDLIA